MITVTRKVEITAEDIANGKPKECSRCPGALAIYRAFPEAKFVDVMDQEVQLAFPSNRRTYSTYVWQTADTPEVLEQFINKFDLRKPVEPISFELTFNVETPNQCSPPSASSDSPCLPCTPDMPSDAESSSME